MLQSHVTSFAELVRVRGKRHIGVTKNMLYKWVLIQYSLNVPSELLGTKLTKVN